MPPIDAPSTLYKLYCSLKKSFDNDVQTVLGQDTPRILIVFLATVMLSLWLTHPWPGDDLLRDMVSWAYSYNYRNMFVYSPGVPSYNQYIYFDLITGWIYKTLPYYGHQAGVLLIQTAATASYLAAVTVSISRHLKGRSDKWLMTAVLLMLVLQCGAGGRLALARPEIFLSAWAIWSTSITSKSEAAVWTVIGLVLIPMYWLSMVYIPVYLMSRRSYAEKIALSSILVVYGLLFWDAWSGGAFIHALENTNQAVKTRIIDVSEDSPVFLLFLSWQFDLLVLALTCFSYRWVSQGGFKSQGKTKKAITNITCVFWFLLPGMIRYADIIVPILAITLCSLWPKKSPLPWTPWARAAVALYLILNGFSIFHASAQTTSFHIKDPKEHRVLAPFDSSMYRLIFENPGIMVAPAMEVGFTEMPIQKMILSIHNGSLSCANLSKFTFTDVMENSLTYIPPCLQLEGVSNTLRLWRVKN